MFVLLVLQYAGYFLLIFPINYWHRRQAPAAYGLTRAGLRWKKLLLAGLGTAALSELPVLTVTLVNSIHPSKTEPWRQALFDTSWKRWEFWLFTGIISWALVPVLEELFFRGYFQRRLAEDWGDGPAILGGACIFTFAHTQYQIPNAYNMGMIVSLLIFAVGFGVVFAWTRSLVPCVIAHAIINIPMTVPWQAALLVAFVLGAFFVWRRATVILRHLYARTSVSMCLLLALVAAIYAAAGARFDLLKYPAAVLLLLAVTLEAMERREIKRLAHAGRPEKNQAL
jgi:membrane protease YdiL (CAAX protease family)